MGLIHTKKVLRKVVKALNFSFLTFLATTSVFADTAKTPMRDITALEIVKEMAPGMNLFNTLDAHSTGAWATPGLGQETIWGNPVTTQPMVQGMADRGFKTLRVPTTWYNHMGEGPDYKIDEEWMDRVEEVVNYAFEADMYVILNLHHEDLKTDDDHKGSWLCPTNEYKEANIEQLKKVWTQIATRFKDYGDYLIFETMNEPREIGSKEEWTGGSTEHREVIDAYNKVAVETIRATGGNNAKRFIMCPQVGANTVSAKSHFGDFYKDLGDDKIILSVHSYDPYFFCLADEKNWGTDAEVKALHNNINNWGGHFKKLGIPVVMGEWGAGGHGDYADRVKLYDETVKACIANDVTPVTWITSYNRTTLEWTQPLIEEAIMKNYQDNYEGITEITINADAETLYVGQTFQIEATIKPETTTAKPAWSSSNTNVATVDDGLVTAKKMGNTIINAVAIGVESAKKPIIVLDTNTYVNFKVEAEDYDEMKEIQLEDCKDEDGGKNVAFVENGDWTSYNVRIDSTGLYHFTARLASVNEGGSLEVFVDGESVGEIDFDIDQSGEWQKWYTTEFISFDLEKGDRVIKLLFKGSYNVNWFTLDLDGTVGVNEDLINKYEVMAFPNPFANNLSVTYSLEETAEVAISVVDVTGQAISVIENDTKNAGNYIAKYNNANLPKGIYFVKFMINGKTFIKEVFCTKK